MSTFEERARARGHWPIRVLALGADERVEPRDESTVDERIAWVAALTREQWAFAGLEMPIYRRGEMPGRVVRPGR